MIELISGKDFAKICEARGFKKRGNVFSRCIGDGILQILTIAPKTYMNPFSPEYSNTQRKSNYICIGLWSMYSNLPDNLFISGASVGSYTPENFLGQRFSSETFMGIHAEYNIMMTEGFDYLDSITNQKLLVDAIAKLDNIAYGGPIPHRTILCAPLLICGNWIDALNKLNGLYVQNWMGFHDKYNHLRDNGEISSYLKHEAEYESRLKNTTELISLILGRKSDKVNALLQSNFQKNLELAMKHSVSISKDFFQLKLDIKL